MINILKSILKGISFIDRVNEYFAKTAAWLFFPVILIMSYEVLRRKGFNNSTIWSHEMSYFLCSLMLMFGMAYVLKIKGHISIDILYGRINSKGKAILDIFSFIVFFVPLWFFGLKLMSYYLIKSYVFQERDYWGCWFPLLWPLKAWTFLGAILLVLQGFAEFIRDIICLIKGGERP